MSQCSTIRYQKVDIIKERNKEYLDAKNQYGYQTLSLFLMTYSLISDAFDGNMCQNVFEKDPETNCVLYENERCDGREGLKELHDGERLWNVENQTLFNVESISLRKGCRLTLYTGNNIIIGPILWCYNN